MKRIKKATIRAKSAIASVNANPRIAKRKSSSFSLGLRDTATTSPEKMFPIPIPAPAKAIEFEREMSRRRNFEDNTEARLRDKEQVAKARLSLFKHIVTGKQIGRASCRERVLRLV